MTFLKRLGIILLKGTAIATGLAPVFSGLSPSVATGITKVSDKLSQIAGIIATVEAVGGALALTGPQKLTAAAPLVAQAILQSDLMTGQKIDDEGLFKIGAEKIANGMVDVLNSLKDDITTEDRT